MKPRSKTKILSIVSWVLFGLSSSLIIAESCVPTGPSGEQSFSFSKILADFINLVSPPKQTVVVSPEKLTVVSSQPSATFEDGSTHSLFNANEAIIGTTKLFSYALQYPEGKADIKNSQVSLECLQQPSEDSYSLTMTPGSDGGQIRIIPLEEGLYRFSLRDESGHDEPFSFEAKGRISPVQIKSNVDSMNIKVGEASLFPFAMTFGDMTRSDGTVDHYLARYYDRNKASFTSSNESIFSVSNGVILGKNEGTASLLFDNETICQVTVGGNYVSEVSSISLEAEEGAISPLDYDYSYGKQLTVHYYNALGEEVQSDEPVLFSSQDELIAKVDNDHLEIVEAEDGPHYQACPGGFVSGYRQIGTTTIDAKLARDPSISAHIEMNATTVPAQSAEIQAYYGSKLIPLEGAELTSGDTITFRASFLPVNAADQRLHVDVSDSSQINVGNNDTNSPSVHFVGSGDLSFSVYSIALGEATKQTYHVSVAAKPVIPESNMEDFHSFIRKAAGHFLLFFFTGVFGSIAVYLTFFTSKRWGVLADFGLLTLGGFSLAGTSELIQAIPALKRGSTWSDVGIDTLGFFIAAFLIGIVFFIISRCKNKQAKKEEEKEN